MSDTSDNQALAFAAETTDPAQRARLSDAAFQSGRQFALDVVGPRFMALFKQAIDLGNQY